MFVINLYVLYVVHIVLDTAVVTILSSICTDTKCVFAGVDGLLTMHILLLFYSMVDLAMVAIPVNFFHLAFTIKFGTSYIIFTVIHHAFAHTVKTKNQFYGILEYHGNPEMTAVWFVVLGVCYTPTAQLILYLLVLFREWCYNKIRKRRKELGLTKKAVQQQPVGGAIGLGLKAISTALNNVTEQLKTDISSSDQSCEPRIHQQEMEQNRSPRRSTLEWFQKSKKEEKKKKKLTEAEVQPAKNERQNSMSKGGVKHDDEKPLAPSPRATFDWLRLGRKNESSATRPRSAETMAATSKVLLHDSGLSSEEIQQRMQEYHRPATPIRMDSSSKASSCSLLT